MLKSVKRLLNTLKLFLDLHLQISWNPSVYLKWSSCDWFYFVPLILFGDTLCLKRSSLICSFHFPKEVCIDINFIYYLLLSLSLSSPLFLSLSFSLSLFLSLFLSLSYCKSMDVFVLVVRSWVVFSRKILMSRVKSFF